MLKGCLTVIVVLGLVVLFVLGYNYLLAKLVIWIAAELFDIDWSEKFMAVFAAVMFISAMISCGISQKR